MSGEYEEGDYYDAHGAPDEYDPYAEEGAEAPGEGDEPEEADEVVLAPVVAATKVRVTGADRTTGILGSSPMLAVMTRFEYSRLIKTYAEMIDAGATLDPRVELKSDKSLDMAEAALNFRASDYEFPIELYRPLPDGREEVWRVSETILPYELDSYGLV